MVYRPRGAGVPREAAPSRDVLKTGVDTGNYYYGARYYDPKVSHWLSVDPMARKFPSLTPYNFTENNPVNMIDPDGMAAQSIMDPTYGGSSSGFEKPWDKYEPGVGPMFANGGGDDKVKDGGMLGEVTVTPSGPSTNTKQTKASAKGVPSVVENRNPSDNTSASAVVASTMVLTASTSEVPPLAAVVLGAGLLTAGGVYLYQNIDNPFPRPWSTSTGQPKNYGPRKPDFPNGGGGSGSDFIKWLTGIGAAGGVSYFKHKYEQFKKNQIEQSMPKQDNTQTPRQFIKPYKKYEGK